MYAWWFWRLLVSVTFHPLSGRTCREDVDECLSQPCFPAVSCTNTLGSFNCGSCPPGFTGDGKMCRGTHNVKVSLAKHDPFLAYCSEHFALTQRKTSQVLQWVRRRFLRDPNRRVLRRAAGRRVTRGFCASRASMFQPGSPVDPVLLVSKETDKCAQKWVRF